jgi:hypothetical protein
LGQYVLQAVGRGPEQEQRVGDDLLVVERLVGVGVAGPQELGDDIVAGRTLAAVVGKAGRDGGAQAGQCPQEPSRARHVPDVGESGQGEAPEHARVVWELRAASSAVTWPRAGVSPHTARALTPQARRAISLSTRTVVPGAQPATASCTACRIAGVRAAIRRGWKAGCTARRCRRCEAKSVNPSKLMSITRLTPN